MPPCWCFVRLTLTRQRKSEPSRSVAPDCRRSARCVIRVMSARQILLVQQFPVYVREDEAADPHHIRLPPSSAVMPDANGVSGLVEQLWSVCHSPRLPRSSGKARLLRSGIGVLMSRITGYATRRLRRCVMRYSTRAPADALPPEQAVRRPRGGLTTEAQRGRAATNPCHPSVERGTWREG
jgi:hypothetical protein